MVENIQDPKWLKGECATLLWNNQEFYPQIAALEKTLEKKLQRGNELSVEVLASSSIMKSLIREVFKKIGTYPRYYMDVFKECCLDAASRIIEDANENVELNESLEGLCMRNDMNVMKKLISESVVDKRKKKLHEEIDNMLHLSKYEQNIF